MSRVLSSLVAILLVLGALSQLATAEGSDDRWRRTAHGWERVNLHGQWVFRSPRPGQEPARFDTHPAALALLQIVTIMGAMVAFPRPKVSRLSWLNEGWQEVFRRSFRASAFGC